MKKVTCYVLLEIDIEDMTKHSQIQSWDWNRIVDGGMVTMPKGIQIKARTAFDHKGTKRQISSSWVKGKL